jgi:superfamily II DNA or RNA helicase/SAM-dependent methyltransferase/SOS-response transcriptional repressor LexA
MDETTRYYRQCAAEFFDSTVAVDISPIRERFTAMLSNGARILDAGCGSGRDAKAFAQQGYRVSAFDASPELAERASSHCGFAVDVRTFKDVDEVHAYDGIWCCASLLHVGPSEMPGVLARLWAALAPGGVLYASFKSGIGTRIHGGRRFTDANESQVIEWLAGLPAVDRSEIWATADQRPDRSENWTNVLVKKTPDHPRRLVTGDRDHFLPHLSEAMSRATEVDLAVAFIKTTGLRLLLPDLQAALGSENARKVRVLTSDYLDITDPEALRLLLLLQEHGAEVRVFVTAGSSFHLKAYIFARLSDGELVEGTAFVGSSNISRQALQEGLEWNYRVVYPDDRGFLEAQSRFEEIFSHPSTVALSDSWIETYEQRRIPPPRSVAPGSHEQEAPPEPTAVQRAALAALHQTRGQGFRRSVVVLATGLGKTWLAAFDAAQMRARRVLFVAHREEILAQAAATFVRIRPRARVGYYMGRSRDAEVDVLCASVQTLARAEHLERFAPQHFDYVVIDEFHHAAAATYRRLLSHFAPSFLLGLTATPDRTDQSDILSLCDDNLIYSCHLFEGITAGLLSPFHYYGILDESVDYREVPWRNGRFDPEALSNKLATLARARHALKEWRQRSQRRTLAFCMSIRHAEFMVDQFTRAGIACAAAYAGSNLGRAQALERLEAGDLKILFTVDLFNEGVDLPSIDTVMMLRPTESKILFLQQLGRGLRRSEGKTHLVVLDFIGNHHSFLQKPQALFGIGSTYKALASFAREVEHKRLTLPTGCYVNYDLGIINFLKSLDSSGPQKDYEALRDVLGRRPTLTEFYRSGASVASMRQQSGSWFQFAAEMGDLSQAERDAVDQAAELLRSVETTSMTKSFKMVLLEAFLELDGLAKPCPIDQLTRRSKDVLHRRRPLLADLSAEMISASADSEPWAHYWRENPIKAWTGGNLASQAAAVFRTTERGEFTLSSELPPAVAPALGLLLQELVDFRLASYESRATQVADEAKVIAFPRPKRDAVELPYFPNLKIACGHFKAGRTDSEEHRSLPPQYGKLDPSRHFIARASGNSMNGGKNPIRDGDYLLLELLSPSKAGAITGSVMAVEREDEVGSDNQYLLRAVSKTRDGRYVLKANNPDYEDLDATDDMRTLALLKAVVDPFDLAIGQPFSREDIPALFGEEFNPGSWNSGHVALNDKKAHVLLVTLSKRGKAEQHRYLDHWIDEHTFHWQSQNATTPASKRGQEIIHHQARGVDIHLFVRDEKLAAGKAAPFVYHGKVLYRSHQGAGPMSVTFDVPNAGHSGKLEGFR